MLEQAIGDFSLNNPHSCVSATHLAFAALNWDTTVGLSNGSRITTKRLLYTDSGLSAVSPTRHMRKRLRISQELLHSLWVASIRDVNNVIINRGRALCCYDDASIVLLVDSQLSVPDVERLLYGVCCWTGDIQSVWGQQYCSTIVMPWWRHHRHVHAQQQVSLWLEMKNFPGNKMVLGIQKSSSATPLLWNALPAAIRQQTNIGTFKRSVKTLLFRKAFC